MERLNEILGWLYSLEYKGINPGLERIEKICALLGNPQKRYKSVIIGGTNGKGSTVSFLASILRESGYRVGAYFSPHLERFNERIAVNGELISDAEIASYTAQIKEKIDSYNSRKNPRSKVKDKVLSPTFFEFTTAMAFEQFARRNVDIAILEVGMGGRFDAVNIVTPALCAVTNVSLDHTEFLGDSLEKIAFEKAGIIKADVPVVLGEEKSGLAELFLKAAKEKGAKAYLTGRDFSHKPSGEAFDFFMDGVNHGGLTPSLRGAHQIKNASLALACATLLKAMYGFSISENALRDGIAKASIDGRLERIDSRMPFDIILDVAHNEDGIRVLRDYLEKNYSAAELVLMLGIMRDKNYRSMVSTLRNSASKIILTRPSNLRSWDGPIMEAIKEGDTDRFEVIEDLGFALRYCLHNVKKGQTLCITGSNFTVGEARSIIWKTFT